MARFNTDGLDDLLADMKRMGELTGETADKMLMAGAEEVKTAWKASAERHKHRLSGDMIESIGYPRSPSSAGDIKSIDIYPQGKDRKGVRNAEKAFILNYRATKKHPPSHWIDEADIDAGPKVQGAMEAIWNEHLKGNT